MLNYFVNVWNKMNTLSTFFVHLSGERWHFFASSHTMKNSISATFSFISPACPPRRKSKLFGPFRASFAPRRSQSKSRVSARTFSPFREPFGQAVFNQEIIQFYTQMMPFLNKNTSSLATAPGEPGEISEGRMGRKGRCFCTKKSLNWDVSGG